MDAPVPAPLPPTGSDIGIDWGIRTTAVTTDDQMDLQYQGHARKHARGLAKHQRRMAMHHVRGAKEQSKQYRKAARKTAREQRKIRWQRQEHARAWAKQIVATHDRIAVEDFKPKFLAKTTMARAMHDAAIGQLKRFLAEEAFKAGRLLVTVPPAYTTMTCNPCGVRAKHRIPLNVRVFRCESCGHSADRDKNAAWNILSWAGFLPATCDGDESLLPVSTGSSSRLVGIPRL